MQYTIFFDYFKQIDGRLIYILPNDCCKYTYEFISFFCGLCRKIFFNLTRHEIEIIFFKVFKKLKKKFFFNYVFIKLKNIKYLPCE